MYVHGGNISNMNNMNNEIITDNSQGKILKGTASTNRSDLYVINTQPQQQPQPQQGQGQGYGNLLVVPTQQPQYQQIQPQQQPITPTNNNTFRQSSVGKPSHIYPQQQPDIVQARPSLPVPIQPQSQQPIINHARPPLPPKIQQQQYPPQYPPQQQQYTQQPQRPSSNEQKRQRTNT